MKTIYWYDYETFGIDTRRDRIAQFAGLRTDEQLQVIGAETVAHCRIADDYLPDPCSCLITGIVPQTTLRDGVTEAAFARCVHRELSQPGTCGAGYNSIRFDDEFTRFLLYRNFYDAYGREWRNGNSRWDLIDTLRLAYALRPEGIEWPMRDDGTASFRLEDLTGANGLEHSEAHDALSDVRATVAMAKLLRARQPRLFDYVYGHRDRRSLSAMLAAEPTRAVLHVSSKYPAKLGCIALVAPLGTPRHSDREFIVFDLRQDPRALLDLSAEEITRRVFTSAEALNGQTERLALKTVRLNRAPVVVPANTLSAEAAERWSIDPALGQTRLAFIEAHRAAIVAKLASVFEPPVTDVAGVDAETALYDGFIEDRDRALMSALHTAADAAEFNDIAARFVDRRLREMVFAYRARNRSETLDARARGQWQDRRRARLLEGADDARTLAQFREEIATQQRREDLTETDRSVLSQLVEYADSVATTLN